MWYGNGHIPLGLGHITKNGKKFFFFQNWCKVQSTKEEKENKVTENFCMIRRSIITNYNFDIRIGLIGNYAQTF